MSEFECEFECEFEREGEGELAPRQRSRYDECMRLVLIVSLFGLAACDVGLGGRSADGGLLDSGRGDTGRDVGVGAPDANAPDSAGPDARAVDAAPVVDAAVVVDAAAVDAWTAPDAWSSPCPGGGGTELDLHLAMLHDNPPDLANWPVTTTLTEVDFTAAGVHVVFSKIDGAGRWPDIMPPGWTGPLQYTMGLVECIDGQWHASAAIQFWYGLSASGGNVALNNQVAINWYYDGRWGALSHRQPATGEIVGLFVAAGNTRGVMSNDPLESPVMERSNVVLVPFPDVNGATHSF